MINYNYYICIILDLIDKIINYFQKQYNYYVHGILDLTGKTKIKEFYYGGNKRIKKLIIGNTVESIGKSGFIDCINLQEIDFTNSIIKEIPEDCFCWCKSIKTIYFSENIKIIKEFVFLCNSLESIFLTGVENIDKFAFFYCLKLNRIEISDSIQVIHEEAFNGHYNEIKITCPDQFYDYFLEKFPNAKINQDCEYLIK